LLENFERARLINLGKERLAEKVSPHIAKRGGWGTGFDILSYEETGGRRASLK